MQPKLVRRNATSNEYYVEFGFPNTPIYPGGAGGIFGNLNEQWSYIRRAVLLFEWTGGSAITSGPNRSNRWDHTNDPSFGANDPAFQISPTGTTSALISSSADGDWRKLRVDFIAKKIPVFNNGQLLWGDAPWEAEFAGTPSLEVTPAMHQVGFNATTATVQVTSNIPYNIYSDARWITTSVGIEEGNKTLTFQIAKNTETLPRKGEVVITGGGIVRKITFAQDVDPSQIPALSPPLVGCTTPPCTTGSATTDPCDDNTPPVLVSMSPAPGARNVSVETEIVMVFSEPVFPVVPGPNFGRINIRRLRNNGIEGGTNGDNGYSRATNYSSFITGIGTNTIRIKPAARLSFDNDFYVEIQPNTFQDAAGNKFEGINGISDADYPANPKWKFTTVALPASPCNRTDNSGFRYLPTCPEMSFSPANGAANVPLNTNLVFNVGREVVLSGGKFHLYRADNNSLIQSFGPEDVATGKLQLTTINGRSTITLDPDQDLLPNMEYYVLIDGTNLNGSFPVPALTDLSGLKFSGLRNASGTEAWRFTTAASSWTRQAAAATALKIQSITLLDASGNNPSPFTNGDVVPPSHYNGSIRFVFNRPVRRFTPDDRNAIPNCNFGGDPVILRRLSDNSVKGQQIQWNVSEVMPHASWTFTEPFTCPQPARCNPSTPRGCPLPANATTNAPTNVVTIRFAGLIGALSAADQGYSLEIGANAFIDVTTGGQFTNIVMEGSNAPVTFGSNGFIIRTVPAAGPQPPAITTLNPANNATGVANTTNLTITFNRAVRRVANTTGNITIRRNSDNAVIAVIPVSHPEVAVNNTTVTIPNSLFGILANSATVTSSYHVLIDANALESFEGVSFAGITSNTTWSFTTTVDNTAPVISTSSAREPIFVPSNGFTGAGLKPTLLMTFTEPVQKGSGNIVLRVFSTNAVVATIPVTSPLVTIRNSRLGPSTQVEIAADAIPQLQQNTRYYVTVDAGSFRDRSNNNFAGFTNNSTWSFTTAAMLPRIVSYTAPPAGPYSFTFDVPVSLITASTTSFAIYRKRDNSIFEEFRPTSGKIVISGNVVTLNNENPFEPGETYYVNIGPNMLFSTAAGTNVRFLGWSGACSGVAEIPRLQQQIHFDSIPDKVYGDAPFTLSATATSGLPVSFTLVSGPVTLQGNTVTILGTGEVTIRASQEGNITYEPAADVVRTFRVLKKTLTVRANNLERPYLQPNPPLTFTYEGFVLGENAQVLDEQPQAVTTATQTSDAGVYPITFTGGQDDNYQFSFVPGTLTIRPIPQTITMAPIADVIYQPWPFLSFPLQATASSGLPVSFTVSGPATISANNILTVTGVGTITVHASQPGTINYLPTTTTVTFNSVLGDKAKALVVKASPNPTNGIVYLNISNPLQEPLRMLITSPQGIVIREVQLGANAFFNFELDLSTFPNGMYNLQIIGVTTRQNVRVVRANNR
ncbi:MAG: Ig-like domain-containing protein [Lacibacter sp.]